MVTGGLGRSCRLADHGDINIFVAILGIPERARIGRHGFVNSRAGGGGGGDVVGGAGAGGVAVDGAGAGHDAVPVPVPVHAPLA